MLIDCIQKGTNKIEKRKSKPFFTIFKVLHVNELRSNETLRPFMVIQLSDSPEAQVRLLENVNQPQTKRQVK